jgi:hypothetical protein
MTEINDLILMKIDDLVGNFLYYDRKEDEELPRGAIEEAVGEDSITIEAMVAKFEESLRSGLA